MKIRNNKSENYERQPSERARHTVHYSMSAVIPPPINTTLLWTFGLVRKKPKSMQTLPLQNGNLHNMDTVSVFKRFNSKHTHATVQYELTFAELLLEDPFPEKLETLLVYECMECLSSSTWLPKN